MKITFKQFMKEYKSACDSQIAHADDALRLCFNAHEKKITELMESGIMEDDPSGYEFHKSFRQTDVTGDWTQDIIIWNLIHASKLFFITIEDWEKNACWRWDD